MSTKSNLIRLKAQIALYQTTDDSRVDTIIFSALMDELSGAAPEGTAAAIEARHHALTGYTFPQNEEIRQLVTDIEEGHRHVQELRSRKENQ